MPALAAKLAQAAWTCLRGHPRLAGSKNVDGRDKPGHDDDRAYAKRYALSLVRPQLRSDAQMPRSRRKRSIGAELLMARMR